MCFLSPNSETVTYFIFLSMEHFFCIFFLRGELSVFFIAYMTFWSLFMSEQGQPIVTVPDCIAGVGAIGLKGLNSWDTCCIWSGLSSWHCTLQQLLTCINCWWREVVNRQFQDTHTVTLMFQVWQCSAPGLDYDICCFCFCSTFLCRDIWKQQAFLSIKYARGESSRCASVWNIYFSQKKNCGKRWRG